jgi:hypothetical protein
VNVPDCPAANDVDVPEHVPAGDANDTQSMADNDDAEDGATCVSVIDTLLSATGPVSVATKV